MTKIETQPPAKNEKPTHWRVLYRQLKPEVEKLVAQIENGQLFEQESNYRSNLLTLAYWWQLENNLSTNKIPPFLLHIAQVGLVADIWLAEQTKEVQNQGRGYTYTHDLGRVIWPGQLHTVLGAKTLQLLARQARQKNEQQYKTKIQQQQFATGHHNWGLGILEFKNGARERIMNLINPNELTLNFSESLVDDLYPHFLPILDEIQNHYGLASLVVLVADASKYLPLPQAERNDHQQWIPEICEFTDQLGMQLINQDIDQQKYQESSSDEAFIINIVSVYFLLATIRYLEKQLQKKYQTVIAETKEKWSAAQTELTDEWSSFTS